jgi:hypothetical protein
MYVAKFLALNGNMGLDRLQALRYCSQESPIPLRYTYWNSPLSAVPKTKIGPDS